MNPYHFCQHLGYNIIGSKEECKNCKVIETRKRLTPENIKVDLHVIDYQGNKGIVKNSDDIHNVFVEYYNGGSGLYCIVPYCLDLDLNGGSTDIFDPLFYLPEVN